MVGAADAQLAAWLTTGNSSLCRLIHIDEERLQDVRGPGASQASVVEHPLTILVENQDTDRKALRAERAVDRCCPLA